MRYRCASITLRNIKGRTNAYLPCAAPTFTHSVIYFLKIAFKSTFNLYLQAYKQGITGKDYVWMLIGWYNHEWWEKEDEHIDCSPEEMREAVKGYISVESLQLGDPDVVTVANIVSKSTP